MTTSHRTSAGSRRRLIVGSAVRLVRTFPLGLCLAILGSAAAPAAAQTAAPGGFLEPTTSTQVRSNAAPTLPARGPFTFPAPYNTLGVRITNTTADCGGADCVDYIGYSYWRNTNSHVGSDTMLIFVTLDRARGGGGPTLFSYDKTTDQVTKVGPIFDSSSAFSWATGEGWYWSPTQPTKLYVNGGAVLYRYDVNTRQFETVFDASTQFGANTYIWQTHTSNDDMVHSATLRDATTYEMLGCLAYSEATQAFSYFPKTGDFDECQIDKSGQWLLIKEQTDGLNGEDNVIVDLTTGNQTVFLDQLGAPGHSDNGYGYMVGEDNWYALPGAARVWQFDQPLPGVPPQGLLVYNTTDWSVDLGHVSHANAQEGVPLSQQHVCISHASRFNLPRANEIVCVRLDGSLQALIVAPVMTKLSASGGGSDDYSKEPKGNLDITGQYFIWTSNMGGNRLEAFVVRVPTQVFDGPATNPDPPSPGTNFADDFNRPDATTLGSSWQAVTGTLVVSGGEARNSPVKGKTLAVVPGLTGATQSVSADFASVNNSVKPNFGLALRFKDAKNYYRLYRTGGQLKISRVVNGTERVLKTANVPQPTLNGFFHLTAAVNGKTLTLQLDNGSPLTVSDSTFTTGTIGIILDSGTGTMQQRADNFTATVQ